MTAYRVPDLQADVLSFDDEGLAIEIYANSDVDIRFEATSDILFDQGSLPSALFTRSLPESPMRITLNVIGFCDFFFIVQIIAIVIESK